MSKWASPVREFHQLITPDGNVYDLTVPSKNGRWVISNQGWGMPPIDWIAESAPFQHGASVRDYRLKPRTIQLLLHDSFCSREAYWSGRQSLIDTLRPNRVAISFDDFWLPRSQYQGGELYPTQIGQTSIKALGQYAGSLFGGTGDDPYDTGGCLFLWDGGSSWSKAGSSPTATDAVDTETGTRINCLLPATITLPVFSIGKTADAAYDSYNTGDDADRDADDIYAQFAQTFTPASSFYVTKARLKLIRTGSFAWPLANAQVRIVPLDPITGEPDLTVAPLTWASNVWQMNISTSAVWVEFPLASYAGGELLLNAGTTYALLFSCTGVDAANYTSWILDSSTPSYAGGSVFHQDFYGDTWHEETGEDFMFEVYGYTYSLIKTGEEQKQVLLAGCGDDGILAVWEGAWNAQASAQQYNAETDILSLVEYLDDVYAGTGVSGQLLRFYNDEATGYGSWELAADQLVASQIYSLIVFDDGGGVDHIYAGTDGGLLYRWTSGTPGSWSQICAQAGGTETAILTLCEYQGNLYGAGNDGILYQYDVLGAEWDAMTTAAGGAIRALAVHRGRLYGAGEDGLLYRWNNADDWEEICDAFIGAGGTDEEIDCMIVYNNRLFGGTEEGAYLLEFMHEMTSRQPQCTVLRRILPLGEKRDLCVFVGDGPQFDDQPEGWRERSFREMIRFIAYNPVMYDPTEIVVDFLLTVGAVSETENVFYTGTWEEHPVLTLTGPLNNPIILAVAVDEHIALEYDIPDGDVVTIDLHNQTVTDNNGNNLLGVVTPESSLATFRLEPHPVVYGGANSISIMASGATANSDFSVSYFRRFIGI